VPVSIIDFVIEAGLSSSTFTSGAFGFGFSTFSSYDQPTNKIISDIIVITILVLIKFIPFFILFFF